IVDSRAAPLMSSGTVYGPPPTRKVVGPEIITCADPIPCDCVGTAAGLSGVPGGVVVPVAGGVPVGAAPGAAGAAAGVCAPGGLVAAPAAGGVTAGFGSGVPGGVCGVAAGG